jgi:tRNA(Ile)-lysidine synthase
VVEAIRGFPGLAGPGVAAVSGGADSVALLRGLIAAGVGPVTVAHFNHLLRGAEADADEAFVRDLAARLGLECRTGSADVASAAAGDNLEATARRLRYDWLARVAADVGAGWVATGHTADDQAETVLHRLIRGTGVRGLRGIAARRAVGSVEIVRPLLTVTRADVLAYLTDRGQPFRDDATNADPTFTRNRIRHELLPLLRTFNPVVAAALARLAEQADAVIGEMDRGTARTVEACELPRAGDVLVFDGSELAGATDHRLAELFRRVWEREGWPLGSMTAAHWRRLTRVVDGTDPAADFPGGVHVRRVGRVVQLSRRP